MIHVRRALSFAALLTIFAAGSATGAERKQKILVLKVRAEQGIPQGTANLLGEILVEVIHRSGKYDAISTADMAAMLDVELQKQQVGCENDTNCLAEIGSAMGADLILDASAGTVGVTRVLAIKLIDSRKAEVKGRETETVAGDEELIGAAHRLVARLLGLPEPAAAPQAEKGLKPGWFVVGGGVALAAAGAVVGLLALKDYDNFKANPFDDPLGDSAQTKAHLADGFWAAGAIAVIAGGVWLLVSDE